MEVIVHQHGSDLPATKVFFSDEKGFEVASVIVTGKEEAVLIHNTCTSRPLFWPGTHRRGFPRRTDHSAAFGGPNHKQSVLR
jgi:hypothetical protein